MLRIAEPSDANVSALFDRSDDYAALLAEIAQASSAFWPVCAKPPQTKNQLLAAARAVFDGLLVSFNQGLAVP